MVSKDSKHTNTFVPSGTSDKIGTGGDSSGTVCVVGRNSLRSSEQIHEVILFIFFYLKRESYPSGQVLPIYQDTACWLKRSSLACFFYFIASLVDWEWIILLSNLLWGLSDSLVVLAPFVVQCLWLNSTHTIYMVKKRFFKLLCGFFMCCSLSIISLIIWWFSCCL